MVTFYSDIILILNWAQMNINYLINYSCNDSQAFHSGELRNHNVSHYMGLDKP